MENKTIKPIDMFVETVSFNFWWAVYGLEDCFWEDITMRYKDRNGKKFSCSTEILTKGYFRMLSEENDEWSRSELEELCSAFNTTLDELLRSEEISYGYDYDKPDSANSYIAIFYPDEKLTVKAVKQAVSKYCRDFCNIPFSNVHILDKPKKGYIKKTFEEEQERRKEHEAFVKSGGKYKVRMTVEFLQQLFGEDELNKFESPVEYGFIRNRNYFVKLADGSERVIGEPNLSIVQQSNEKK